MGFGNHSWVTVKSGPYQGREGVVVRTSAQGWVRVKVLIHSQQDKTVMRFRRWGIRARMSKASQYTVARSFHPSQLEA